jgi:hypothetical protein
MKRYMRGQFEYLGIKSPQLGELLRDYYAKNGFPALRITQNHVIQLRVCDIIRENLARG